MTTTILESVCADELAEPCDGGIEPQATAAEQAFRTIQLGIRHVAVRFFWIDGKRISVTALDAKQLEKVRYAFKEGGMRVLTIASPIGKCWLSEEGGPAHTRYMTKQEVCDQLDGACKAADVLEAPMVRVFSGYPKHWVGTAATEEVIDPDAVRLLKLIATRLKSAGLIGVVENEKYLAGWDAGSLLLHLQEAGADNLRIALDAGNLQHVGLTSLGLRGQVKRILNSGLLAALHLKECAKLPNNVSALDFTEAMLAPYHVPAGTGDAGFHEIFQEVVSFSGQNQGPIECMIEGHLRSGGAFHGSSGVEGVKKIQQSMHSIWEGLDIKVI